jgi:hypothetical protein
MFDGHGPKRQDALQVRLAGSGPTAHIARIVQAGPAAGHLRGWPGSQGSAPTGARYAPGTRPGRSRDRRNPRGTATYDEPAFTNTQAAVGELDRPPAGHYGDRRHGTQREQVFDRLTVTPYAYRHSYA